MCNIHLSFALKNSKALSMNLAKPSLDKQKCYKTTLIWEQELNSLILERDRIGGEVFSETKSLPV